jgi:hypothetical protein
MHGERARQERMESSRLVVVRRAWWRIWRGGGIELEDLVVDEKTGRVTMKTPDSMPDGDKHHAHWPL